MVDIQSAVVNALATPAATTPALTPVQVAVIEVTQALANLTRSIQTSGTPVSASENGAALTLATSLGTISVALGQNIGVAEKQNLTQQILNLVQTQKPLTLTIQPGSPPTQAVLLLPTLPQTVPQSPTATPATTPVIAQTSSGNTTPTISAGTQFSAVVLSNNAALQPQISLNVTPQILASTPTPPLTAGNKTQPAQVNQSAPTASPAAVNSVPLTSSQPSPLSVSPTLSTNPVPAQTSPQPTASVSPSPLPQTQTAQLSTQNPSASQNTTAPNTIQTIASDVANNPAFLLLKPGNEVSVRIISVLPPQQPNSPLPVLAPNQSVATVTATGTNGNLVLTTGNATLFAKTPATAPIGAQVIITLDPVKSPPPLVVPPTDTQNFPALPQALTELAQIAPQIAQQVMANHIPQPTEALPGALLFLFNAFKQGNIKSWLGSNAVETLIHNGKSALINSLSRNLSEAGQPAQDPVVGEWKSYPIPLFAQQQFQALTLYVHSDRDAHQETSAPDSKPSSSVRFLIDMRLSKLGNLQVDGFVQNKKLDMVLRSENNLPDGLHNELRLAYIRAVGAVGYAGSLNFQVGRRHWMSMQQPAVQGIVT